MTPEMQSAKGMPYEQIGPINLPLDLIEGKPEHCICRYFGFAGGRYLVAEVGNMKELKPEERILVRIQSACAFGDLFQSRWCDCAWQFRAAKAMLVERGKGLLIHAFDQHGKGLKLDDHYRVYAEGQKRHQELLTETFDFLGFDYENRHYDDIATILKDFYSLSHIELMTNDPVRLEFFRKRGFDVKRTALEPTIDQFNIEELKIKKEKFGHMISLPAASKAELFTEPIVKNS